MRKWLLPVVLCWSFSAQQVLAQGAISESASPMPKGRCTALIRDAEGTTYQVSLFDPHEKEEVDRSPGSEFNGDGAKYYTGTYQVVLRRKGATKHLVERIPLFGSDTTPNAEGVFTPWHKRVFVIKGEASLCADLLVITQYELSNNDMLRAFLVQKGMLVPINWRLSSKDTKIAQDFDRGLPIKRLQGNTYQTEYFTNGEQGYGKHVLTWRFDPKDRRMFLLHEVRPK